MRTRVVFTQVAILSYSCCQRMSRENANCHDAYNIFLRMDSTGKEAESHSGRLGGFGSESAAKYRKHVALIGPSATQNSCKAFATS